MGLSDILNGSGGFFDGWDNVSAAGDQEPIPPGKYVAYWTRGTPQENRRGTPEYLLEFTISEGTAKGRRQFYPVYLTLSAKSQAKRDFEKLGMSNPRVQMTRPIPQGIRCEIDVVVRRDDDGNVRNKVRSFKVIGIDPPPVNPFPPDDGNGVA